MSTVTEDEIRSLGSLARLQLSDTEVAQLKTDLVGILEHMDALKEVDTEGVVPMSHVLGTVGHLRSDVVLASLPTDDALAASPAHADGLFSVPAILPPGSNK
ncbi:MAG: Asp-tRNA(Asn)/Glu-tRNA(Gln) amidotransferase subunit GatC [Myxococcales bacterium]|nr:Asp-tRNA(Asn)/Glu-tRNA(Gln) amidotransferase subunit GatC [Myxococcales bacterium]